MNFIVAVCLTTYPPSLVAHLVSLRTVKFVGRRNKRLLTKKGMGARQEKTDC